MHEDEMMHGDTGGCVRLADAQAQAWSALRLVASQNAREARRSLRAGLGASTCHLRE